MVAQFAPCLRARLMSLTQWAYRLLILFQLLPPLVISRTRVYSFQISAGGSKDCSKQFVIIRENYPTLPIAAKLCFHAIYHKFVSYRVSISD